MDICEITMEIFYKLINVNIINEKCFYAMENIPWLKPNPTTPSFSLLLLLFDDLVHE
jgi:hypothetical protein